MINMPPIAEYFSYQEMIKSDTADRLDIDNSLQSPQHLGNLLRLLAIMDDIRKHFAQPIVVTSGYRCEALNKALGGTPNSAHCEGRAIDFVSPSFGPPSQIFEEIRLYYAAAPPYDQLIMEAGRWVHLAISRRAQAPRHMALSWQPGVGYSPA